MPRTILLAMIVFAAGQPAFAHSKQHPHVTCDMVRAYVASVGLPHAEALAVAHGMTRSEAQRARQCLADKI